MEEALFEILCSTTHSESTQFQASKKNKVVVDELPEEKDIKNNIGISSFKEKLDEELFYQNF